MLLGAAASLLFVKAVLRGSTACCLPQRMTFIKAVSWGFAAGPAGWKTRRSAGEPATVADGIWPRADVECLLQYAFSFLIPS